MAKEFYITCSKCRLIYKAQKTQKYCNECSPKKKCRECGVDISNKAPQARTCYDCIEERKIKTDDRQNNKVDEKWLVRGNVNNRNTGLTSISNGD